MPEPTTIASKSARASATGLLRGGEVRAGLEAPGYGVPVQLLRRADLRGVVADEHQLLERLEEHARRGGGEAVAGEEARARIPAQRLLLERSEDLELLRLARRGERTRALQIGRASCRERA